MMIIIGLLATAFIVAYFLIIPLLLIFAPLEEMDYEENEDDGTDYLYGIGVPDADEDPGKD